MFCFLLVIFFCIGSSMVWTDDCVTPPLSCPNANITFWLFTKSHQKQPHEISMRNLKTIRHAPWVKGAIKILFHGYTGYRDYSPNTEIRPVYLECCDYNIISVDYNKVALEDCYIQSAHNTELVGMCTAQLIDQLVDFGFRLEDFHLIGFSLGAHVAAYTANYLKSGRLQRITALDPALPLFATAEKKDKIDSGDAIFVDVLHTNVLEKGKLERSGHIDFYANDGRNQPGCKADENFTLSGCNHARAPRYFAESIISNDGFYGLKCHSWIAYMLGWCNLLKSEEEVLFGEFVPRHATGVYFFKTNSESPYAKGPSNLI